MCCCSKICSISNNSTTIAPDLIDELDDGLVAATTELMKTIELEPISGMVYFFAIFLFFFLVIFLFFFFMF